MLAVGSQPYVEMSEKVFGVCQLTPVGFRHEDLFRAKPGRLLQGMFRCEVK